MLKHFIFVLLFFSNFINAAQQNIKIKFPCKADLKESLKMHFAEDCNEYLATQFENKELTISEIGMLISGCLSYVFIEGMNPYEIFAKIVDAIIPDNYFARNKLKLCTFNAYQKFLRDQLNK